jgi:AAHS family 4-hydroxybenzoate transporter-like MFS transporter
MLLDGLENQLLGLVVPTLIKEWHVTRADFAVVFSIGLLGNAIGGSIGGVAGDRLGRKPLIVVSVLVFGVMTACAALASGTSALALIRFVAGLGLGAYIPNGAALISEITPFRSKNIAIAITIAGAPIGGIVGAAISAYMLPEMGWRPLFVICGSLPIPVALGAILLLPESPSFLNARSNHRALARTLRRLGHRVNDDAIADDDQTGARHIAPWNSVFAKDQWRNTTGLAIIFILAQYNLFGLLSWAPLLMSGAGFPTASVSAGIISLHSGSIAGALCVAWFIQRLGSRMALSLLLLGAASVAPFGLLHVGPESTIVPWLAVYGIAGLFAAALISSMYVVAAHAFPPLIRSTGIGFVLTASRVGSILSPLILAKAMHASAAVGYFLALELPMLLGLLGVLIIGNHIPRPAVTIGVPQSFS